MAEVMEPSTNSALHKKLQLTSIPNIDSLDGDDGNDEYASLKRLQRHLEYVFLSRDSTNTIRYINLQEEYIKDEQRSVGFPLPSSLISIEASRESWFERKRRLSGYRVFLWSSDNSWKQSIKSK